jgi:hypothetical protein
MEQHAQVVNFDFIIIKVFDCTNFLIYFKLLHLVRLPQTQNASQQLLQLNPQIVILQKME